MRWTRDPVPTPQWWTTSTDDLPPPRTKKTPVDWEITKVVLKELIRRLRAGEPMPQTCTDEPWIWSKDSFHEGKVRHVGKWLIFVDPSHINGQWVAIDLATSMKELGVEAKVTTAFEVLDGHHVICVYTVDWRDEADVMRVREYLRRLGFTDTLFYKRDDDTRAGRSTHTYKA